LKNVTFAKSSAGLGQGDFAFFPPQAHTDLHIRAPYQNNHRRERVKLDDLFNHIDLFTYILLRLDGIPVQPIPKAKPASSPVFRHEQGVRRPSSAQEILGQATIGTHPRSAQYLRARRKAISDVQPSVFDMNRGGGGTVGTTRGLFAAMLERADTKESIGLNRSRLRSTRPVPPAPDGSDQVFAHAAWGLATWSRSATASTYLPDLEESRHGGAIGILNNSGSSNYALGSGSVRPIRYGRSLSPVNLWSATDSGRTDYAVCRPY
jgi:hypothetical protein